MNTVVALAGRRIDAPAAAQRRFPLHKVADIKNDLQAYFAGTHPVALVCSAACGADLLALEVAGNLGIKRTIILPFPHAVFKAISVTDCAGDWGRSFDLIHEKVQHEGGVVVLHYSPHDQEAFKNTNLEILNHAQQLLPEMSADGKAQVIALLVWDGKLKEAGDTTGHFRQEARNRGIKVEEIFTLK